jgi:hypothetical protein
MPIVARFPGWTRKKGGRLQPDNKCEVAFDAIDAFAGGLIGLPPVSEHTKKVRPELVRSISRNPVICEYAMAAAANCHGVP